MDQEGIWVVENANFSTLPRFHKSTTEINARFHMLLEDGWEPFAVTPTETNSMYVYHFRKLMIPEKAPVRHN